MALPASGPIDLGQIQTEFGGSAPIAIDEYYQGAVTGYVTSSNYTPAGQIPTGGAISFANFYGVAKNAVTQNGVWTVTAANLGNSTSRITFASDGSTNSTGTINPVTVVTPNWIAPTTPGVGGSYWARFTVINYNDSENDPYGGNITGTTVPAGWVSLSTSPFVQLDSNSVASASWQVGVEFSTTSNGSNIVGTGSINMSVGNSTPASFTFNDTVSSNLTGGYDLRNRAIAAGWNGTAILNATITINSGIYVIGTTSAPAFTLGSPTLPGSSTVTLTNNGIIAGAGGNGGTGGSANNGSLTNGVVGFNGNTAFSVNYAINVYNYGTIGGGGGGGGGGASGTFVDDDGKGNITYYVANGAGGGGGRALDTFAISGGYAGANGSISGNFAYGVTGAPTNASFAAPGAGGIGGGVGPFGPDGGNGGAGGNLGQPGSPGLNCGGEATATSIPGGGGAAGAAIIGGANIFWYAYGNRFGSIDNAGTNMLPGGVQPGALVYLYAFIIGGNSGDSVFAHARFEGNGNIQTVEGNTYAIAPVQDGGDWYSANVPGIGSGYSARITRTSGTSQGYNGDALGTWLPMTSGVLVRHSINGSGFNFLSSVYSVEISNNGGASTLTTWTVSVNIDVEQ